MSVSTVSYFLPGAHLCEIVGIKEWVNKRGSNFVAEFKILDSDNPDCEVGTVCPFLVTSRAFLEMSRNLQDFLRAATGSRGADIDWRDFDLVGKKIHVFVNVKTTSNHHRWEAAS